MLSSSPFDGIKQRSLKYCLAVITPSFGSRHPQFALHLIPKARPIILVFAEDAEVVFYMGAVLLASP